MTRYCQKRALKLGSYSAFLTVLIQRIDASGKLVVLHLLIMKSDSLKLCLPDTILGMTGSHLSY